MKNANKEAKLPKTIERTPSNPVLFKGSKPEKSYNMSL